MATYPSNLDCLGIVAYWPTLPVFPGKIPGNPHYFQVVEISSKLPEKSQFCLIQDFPENSMDSTRMSRFFQKITMYGAHSHFELCTALSRSEQPTIGCKIYTDRRVPTDRTALQGRTVQYKYADLQSRTWFLAGKALFRLFLCRSGILREIQGFWMPCQGIEILVVGQCVPYFPGYKPHRGIRRTPLFEA